MSNRWQRAPVRIELRPDLYGRGFSAGYPHQDGLAFYDTTDGHVSLVRLQEGVGPLTAVTAEQFNAWKNLPLVAVPVFRAAPSTDGPR